MRSSALIGVSGIVVALALTACGKGNAAPPAPTVAEDTAGAEVGKAAPDFTLKDVDGKPVTLSSFKGKTVVLEWFNPDCPFVKRVHGSDGPLKTMAVDAMKDGVVWLSINSGGPGSEGAGAERNKQALSEYAMANPILLDESGAVGKLYKAHNTPGMYIVDAKGVLVYAGALDNAPRGEAPPEGYHNHVQEALADIAAGRPVRVSETKQYGCGVHYAK